MPDHFHLIANPRDGRIKEFTGHLKAVAAKAIIQTNTRFVFKEADKGHGSVLSPSPTGFSVFSVSPW